MSKRRNPTSIDFYRRAGYLPEALLNYLALMAYPPGEGGEEKFPLSELVGRFDLGRINLGGSVFDLEKLSWLNGRYIREDLTAGELLDRLKEWAMNDGFIGQMIPLMQPRMQTLGDFMPACSFFFAREVEPPAEDLVPKKRQPAEAAQMLLTAVWALQEVSPWNVSAVEAAVHGVSSFWEWPVREVTRPMFTALMGRPVGPPLYESIVLLDIDLTRARLQAAVGVLGGVSRKRSGPWRGSGLPGAGASPGYFLPEILAQASSSLPTGSLLPNSAVRSETVLATGRLGVSRVARWPRSGPQAPVMWSPRPCNTGREPLRLCPAIPEQHAVARQRRSRSRSPELERKPLSSDRGADRRACHAHVVSPRRRSRQHLDT